MALLLSTSAYAGEWIRVKGGVSAVKIDCLAIEGKLWKYIKKASKIKFQPKENYLYQYKIINIDEIYINALCETYSNKDLENDFIVVFDGGSCFFQITYNLKEDSFSKLFVNGDA